jgi:mono/diheme cytochrome c family protein
MIKALRTILLSVLLALSASWVAGCGSARRGVPTDPPLALTDSTLVRGQRVFMQFCNGCHPGGTGGVGLALNNKPLPGFVIRYQVRHGLGAMPAFSKEVIPDRDLDALTAFVKALRDHPD